MEADIMRADQFLKTQSGKQLFDLLPEIYRTRDTIGPEARGDLARYLDACGHLLDLIRRTLDQRLADIFPDDPAAEPSGQTWLLPYIADLLDVRMVSPDEAGRREEVANAVAWRQRKGTLKVVEQIAEQVGRLEIELQEGWKRVATTQRVGLPLLPAKALGECDKFDDFKQHPNWAARHPGLNSSMVDLRYPSRAMQLDDMTQNPAAKQTNFGGTTIWWRQVNPHGAPCFPGSYEDIARRTVDVRTPSWQQGHHHPKRALLYAPPPLGFFAPDSLPVVQDPEFSDGGEHLLENHHVEGTLVVNAGRLTLRRCTVEKLDISVSSPDELVLEAEDCLFDTLLAGAGVVSLESCTVMDQLTVLKIDAANCLFNDGSISSPITGTIRYSRVPASSIAGVELVQCTTEKPLFFSDRLGAPVRGVLRPDAPQPVLFGAEDGGELGAYHHGRQGRPVRIPLADEEEISVAADSAYLLSDLLFEGQGTLRIVQGALNLQRVAVARLVVYSASDVDEQGALQPVLVARDCLFDQVETAEGLARLEYCTVLTQLTVDRLQASDCLFVSGLTLASESATASQPHCIRFSRIPPGPPEPPVQFLLSYHNTSHAPVFQQFEFDEDDGVIHRQPEFGEPGCAVLHPATSEQIRFGAEDGGEMGAHHGWRYSLLMAAVQDKLRDFLPVGIEAVIVPDLRLYRLPTEAC
jgi:hypothetical protein